jgi:thiol-disulfide isomerase/thioredoxin
MELAPISGKPFRLSELQPAKAIVIAFISTSCPLSKRYAPTLAKLEREYAERGVQFIFIDPLATDSKEQITETIRAHGFKGEFIRDTNREIRNTLAARSTTEAFVLDAARTLVYRGAVDDQYGLGYSLDVPRQRHLVEALEATLANNTPRVRATTAPGCALEVAAKKTADTTIDFHGRISRIVQQHCQECHHAGGVAPFALETYNDVANHAGMICKMVEKNLMPPWFAAPTPLGHASPWANDRTLPADDKRDLLAWMAEGKKEGNPSDAPLPLTFAKDWQIGTPDAVIQIPTPLAVKATGKMPYQNVFVDTTFGEDRWVQALEVRPTAREVVHHVLVFILPKQTNAPATATNSTARRRRARQDEGGNFFAAYVPGNNLLHYDSGFAKLLPKGATLHFQIHYTPNGTAATDQTRLGLVFAKEPPRHEVRVVGIANPLLRIPPGADNYEVPAATPVLFDAKVLSFMPHMHLRGKAFRYELARPDGTKKLLLDVPRYDFNWQLQYKLIEPIDAPLGSRLLATGWYDNSTNNPANPDPAREVKWGPQTDDEMMLGYLEYYVPSLKPGDKTSLTQAVRDGALMFNVLDKNHDGKITRDEAPSPASFRQADVDADGSVTREELKNYLQRNRR